MQIFIEAIDLNIWEAIEIGPYVPTIVDASTSTTTEKPRDKWSEEDRRRVQYNLKAKNKHYPCKLWKKEQKREWERKSTK